MIGIVLAAVITKMLDRNGKYKLTQLILITLITSSLGATFLFMLLNTHEMLITLPLTLYAALQMVLVPVTFSYGNEITFPVHAALT